MRAIRREFPKGSELFEGLRSVSVPKGGWIRAVRKARGLSLNAIAQRMDLHRQNIFQSEKAEERGQILLSNLRRIAEAMDCELVYAIIPKPRCAKADLRRDTLSDK
jgi:predicted DNA-binding mobile mystery protein A